MPAIHEGKRTYIGPFGDRHEIMAPHLTDKQVADEVRMLMRHQLNHESICMLARDRIMHLSERVADLEDGIRLAVDHLKADGQRETAQTLAAYLQSTQKPSLEQEKS